MTAQQNLIDALVYVIDRYDEMNKDLGAGWPDSPEVCYARAILAEATEPYDELALRVQELTEAIEALCLGSVETVVIDAAVAELRNNWADHNKCDGEMLS